MAFVRRNSFVVFWITLLIGVAVAVALWVDSASGTLRDVIAFEPLHVVGHIVLFAILAFALAPLARRRVVLATVVFIASAVGQEWAQSFALGRSLSADSVYDVGVDLIGGAIGLLVALALAARQPGAQRS